MPSGSRKSYFCGNAILIPADDFLPFVPQGEGEAELRAHAIAIRADVADDTERAALPDAFDDAVNNLWVRLHWNEIECRMRVLRSSARSGACRVSCVLFFRLGRRGLFQLLDDPEHSIAAHDRVVHQEPEGGGVFQDDRPAHQPWMRLRWRASSENPRFCWSGLPRMLMKTTAECRSPATSTSLTVIRPASLTWNSRRMASPICALEQFAHALKSERSHGSCRVTSLPCYIVEWAG